MHAASIRTSQFFPKQWHISQASVHLISYARYCVVYIVLCLYVFVSYLAFESVTMHTFASTSILWVSKKSNIARVQLQHIHFCQVHWQRRWCGSRGAETEWTEDRRLPKGFVGKSTRHGGMAGRCGLCDFFLGPRFKLQGGSKSAWTSSESHWSEELWTVVLVF